MEQLELDLKQECKKLGNIADEWERRCTEIWEQGRTEINKLKEKNEKLRQEYECLFLDKS